MTVKELIDLLTKQDPNALVILGDNSAYNKYSLAKTFDGNMRWFNGDEIAYELGKDETTTDPPCVVIYPDKYGFEYW